MCVCGGGALLVEGAFSGMAVVAVAVGGSAADKGQILKHVKQSITKHT